jgi:transposase-like protein
MRRRPSRRCRRSPEEIAEILRDYDRSDLTQRAFAESNGLSLASLSLWLRKAREGGAADGSPRLVPVRLRGEAGTGFELIVEAGTLRIPADFDEDALRRLLQVFASRC